MPKQILISAFFSGLPPWGRVELESGTTVRLIPAQPDNPSGARWPVQLLGDHRPGPEPRSRA